MPLNLTSVAPLKLFPTMVTSVPTGPDVGENEVIETEQGFRVPESFISSILNCGVVLVCLNLITRLGVEGIDPVGLIKVQTAVPVPVGREYVNGVNVTPSELTSITNSLLEAVVLLKCPKLKDSPVYAVVLIPEIVN